MFPFPSATWLVPDATPKTLLAWLSHHLEQQLDSPKPAQLYLGAWRENGEAITGDLALWLVEPDDSPEGLPPEATDVRGAAVTALSHAAAFALVPATSGDTEVRFSWRHSACAPLIEEIVGALRVRNASVRRLDGAEPTKAKRLGTNGSTLGRVREARQLIEAGEPKTQACRRAGIDPRTYDRYVLEVIFPED